MAKIQSHKKLAAQVNALRKLPHCLARNSSISPGIAMVRQSWSTTHLSALLWLVRQALEDIVKMTCMYNKTANHYVPAFNKVAQSRECSFEENVKQFQ